jgi:hypothetical protein
LKEYESRHPGEARAGSLAYLFSQRPLSRNEQHEPHAGSFPARRQNRLQRCAEIRSSQAPGATPSAIRKRVSHLPGFSALTSDTLSEECFSELVPLQPEGLGACVTAFPAAQGRGSKLVTEDWKPVGSGRFRDQSRDAQAVPGLVLALLIRDLPTSVSLLCELDPIWWKIKMEQVPWKKIVKKRSSLSQL